jgi:antitoxin VapB
MKTAKIFKNGQSQAVRLPMEFRIDGSEVYIKKMGNAIVLIPMQNNPWDSLIEGISQFSDDFMPRRTQPPTQDRGNIF